MLSETPFNDENIAHINAGREFEKFLLKLVYMSIVGSLISGFIGIRDGVVGYLVVFVISLPFFVMPPFCKLVLHKYKYMLELDRKIKHTGEITILKKNNLSNKCTLHTDASLQKKIHLNNETVFDRIEIEDVLYIEISKYTNTIFKLLEGKRDLFKHLDVLGLPSILRLENMKRIKRKL